MTSRLFIWLVKHSAQTFAWGIERQGVFESMVDSSLADIADYIATQADEVFEVVVLLGGDLIFSSVITVPEQQAKFLQQSLPYLVEEQLTEDIDDMLLMLGPKVAPNQYLVVGIARAQLEHHIHFLEQAQIKPHVMVADNTCCPADSVFVTKQKTLMQSTAHQSYSVDIDNTVDFVSHYLASHHNPSINWIMEAPIQAQALQWLESVIKNVNNTAINFNKQTVDDVLHVLVDQYQQTPEFYRSINFLQGKYARKLTNKTAPHHWQKIILVIGMVLALHLLFDIFQGIYLSVKTHQLESQSKAFYKELFPNDTVTDNVKAQMTGKLKAADAGSTKHSFLDIYSRIVTAIDSQHLQTSLNILQVSFNDDKGEVHLELFATNFEQLTQLKELLVKDGLQAEIGSATTEENKTKASLKIWQ